MIEQSKPTPGPGIHKELAAAEVTPLQLTLVGSRATCSPSPTDTDEDWLALLAPADFDRLTDHLLGDEWKVGGSLIDSTENTIPEEHRFNSFKRGDCNLLLTCSERFHSRFLAASSVAKRLNLLGKADRIALFQAVLYSNSCDPAFQHCPVAKADAATESKEAGK